MQRYNEWVTSESLLGYTDYSSPGKGGGSGKPHSALLKPKISVRMNESLPSRMTMGSRPMALGDQSDRNLRLADLKKAVRLQRYRVEGTKGSTKERHPNLLFLLCSADLCDLC